MVTAERIEKARATLSAATLWLHEAGMKVITAKVRLDQQKAMLMASDYQSYGTNDATRKAVLTEKLFSWQSALDDAEVDEREAKLQVTLAEIERWAVDAELELSAQTGLCECVDQDELEMLRSDLAKANSQWDEVNEQNQRLASALMFYADHHNWGRSVSSVTNRLSIYNDLWIPSDNGWEPAEKALKA